MAESVEESRSGDEGQDEAGDESGLAEPDEAEQPVRQPEPPGDVYVPV